MRYEPQRRGCRLARAYSTRPVAPLAAPQMTANALNVLHLAGLPHVPVHAGAAKPLLRPARICDEIHGDSGLDGA